MQGRFITLEGSEGVGKTSNLEAVVESLQRLGITVVQTREPGGTPLAEALRDLLLQPRDEPVDPQAELLMVFAARAQHLREVVRPALARGDWVVCDRFTDATYAYQGGGRGGSQATIAALEAMVHGDLQPHLTLYLDLDPDIARARISNRELDRFEREERAFFNRVREAYLARAQAYERFVTVDASRPLETVRQDVTRIVTKFARKP